MGRVETSELLILNWRDIKHPLAGGAEISLFEHAKSWVKSGIKVTWFASAFEGGKKEENINGVKVIRRGSQFTVHLYAFIYYIRRRLGSPRVVIDSYHFIPFFTPLYVKNSKIIALINEIAGRLWFSNIIFPLAAVGYVVEQLSFIFYRESHFITASESTETSLLEKNIDKKKIFLVPHGATIIKTRKVSKEKNPTLIFLGRISSDKGVLDLLTTFEKVSKVVANCNLWIVGKEEQKGILSQMFKKYVSAKAVKKIKYFGFVDQRKKFELLGRAWILVHPSKKEGWGLTVIEAGSKVTPTVGYDVEGLRDSIINGRTGVLCAPEPASLVASILDLLQDPKKRLTMGKEAHKWSKTFTWEESTKKSTKVIKRFFDKNVKKT